MQGRARRPQLQCVPTGGHQVEVAPVHEVVVWATAEAPEAQPPRDADPSHVDGDGSEAVRGADELDVGNAADAPARDVEALRVEYIAAQAQLTARDDGHRRARAQDDARGLECADLLPRHDGAAPASLADHQRSNLGMLVLEDNRDVLEPTRPNARGVGHLDADAVGQPQQCGAPNRLSDGRACRARSRRGPTRRPGGFRRERA